jgi:uncharacterized protein (TIGR02145 family)
MKHTLTNPATHFAMLLMALAMAFTISCESKEEKQAKAEAEAAAKVVARADAARAEAKAAKAGEAEEAEASEAVAFKSVKIGDQVWMAENLNYKIGNSWCYNNDESNCKKYGRLYDWETAVKACPSEWHLPSSEEWEILVEAVGGEKACESEDCYSYVYINASDKLKSKTGWNNDENGIDKFGFSALPGGNRESSGGWWSTDDSFENGRATYWGISHIVSGYNGAKNARLSVRCVKDETAEEAKARLAKAEKECSGEIGESITKEVTFINIYKGKLEGNLVVFTFVDDAGDKIFSRGNDEMAEGLREGDKVSIVYQMKWVLQYSDCLKMEYLKSLKKLPK